MMTFKKITPMMLIAFVIIMLPTLIYFGIAPAGAQGIPPDVASKASAAVDAWVEKSKAFGPITVENIERQLFAEIDSALKAGGFAITKAGVGGAAVISAPEPARFLAEQITALFWAAIITAASIMILALVVIALILREMGFTVGRSKERVSP